MSTEDILIWYNREKSGFTFNKRRKVLESWIDICTKEKKYVLAAGLIKELEILNSEDNFLCRLNVCTNKICNIFKELLNK